MYKKPILTTAHCHQTVSEDKRKSGSDQFVMLKTVDYVVLINTLHPLVQDQLEMAFQSAEELLKERKNFRITVRSEGHFTPKKISYTFGKNPFVFKKNPSKIRINRRRENGLS